MVKIDNRIPQRGDIFRLSLNPRVGSEQSGYRPVIVISPTTYNQIFKIILRLSWIKNNYSKRL